MSVSRFATQGKPLRLSVDAKGERGIEPQCIREAAQ